MGALQDKYLPHYTYDDYIKWEGHWEIIEGIPYAMAPAPGLYHQSLNLAIASQLKEKLENCKFCKAYIPIDYKINEDTVVQPDALVVCEPYEIGAYLTKTPEIVFEILSPSTRIKDLNVKYSIYETQGVKYYVIVDPEDKTVTVYSLDSGKYKKILKTGHESFDFQVEGCPFSFDFAKIW
jgi:Uma2 family endonuclease